MIDFAEAHLFNGMVWKNRGKSIAQRIGTMSMQYF